ncbi:MAG: hypothetical protein WDW36_009745 [Sanguina aurantia]
MCAYILRTLKAQFVRPEGDGLGLGPDTLVANLVAALAAPIQPTAGDPTSEGPILGKGPNLPIDMQSGFSRESTIYSILQPAFWRFSMDELFTIDFPDTLAYVLEATGHSKIYSESGAPRFMRFDQGQEYDLTKVTAKVAMYTGQKDALSSPASNDLVIERLKKSGAFFSDTRFPSLAHLVSSALCAIV